MRGTTFSLYHKVRIYKEYHSVHCVCPLVGIGTLPTPLLPASVPLHPEPGMGNLSCGWRVGGGGGGPNSDDLRKSLALCLLCGLRICDSWISKNICAHLCKFSTRVNDTDGKFAAGVKFSAVVNDTSGNLPLVSTGTNFARLCSLAGRYDNPIRFLTPIDCLKMPARVHRLSGIECRLCLELCSVLGVVILGIFGLRRREIITLRGQSYVSRLPKYWPPPLSARRVCPSPGGEGVDILEDARHRIALLQ